MRRCVVGCLSARSVTADDEDYRCVVYLPDDPLHPLKNIRRSPDLKWSVLAIESGGFPRTCVTSNWVTVQVCSRPLIIDCSRRTLYRSLPVAHPFRCPVSDFEGDVVTEMFHQRSQKIACADARLLVVPTGDEDEKSRLARLDTCRQSACDLVLFAASFLPVVGDVLLVVTGTQLLAQIYEGVANASSWSRGEQEQAMDYLFDTLENLILTGAFAAGDGGGWERL